MVHYFHSSIKKIFKGVGSGGGGLGWEVRVDVFFEFSQKLHFSVHIHPDPNPLPPQKQNNFFLNFHKSFTSLFTSSYFFMRNPHMKFQDSSFKGLKVTVGTKSVTHPRTHARSKSNMPHQLFQSWGHNNVCDSCLPVCINSTV